MIEEWLALLLVFKSLRKSASGAPPKRPLRDRKEKNIQNPIKQIITIIN
jgi:hypothetical protein